MMCTQTTQREDRKVIRRINSKAYSKLSTALKNGIVVRPSSCSACGSGPSVDAHHTDYNKPLDIIWLCRKCHRGWHRNNKAIDRKFADAEYDEAVIAQAKTKTSTPFPEWFEFDFDGRDDDSEIFSVVRFSPAEFDFTPCDDDDCDCCALCPSTPAEFDFDFDDQPQAGGPERSE